MVKAVFLAAVFLFVGCTQPEVKPEEHPTLAIPAPHVVAPCVITGCNSEICSDRGSNSFSTCIVLPQYACLRHSRCEPQDDGHCGWTNSKETLACLKKTLP